MTEKNFIEIEDGEWYQQRSEAIVQVKKLGDCFFAGYIMYHNDGCSVEYGEGCDDELMFHVEAPSIVKKPAQEMSGRILYKCLITGDVQITPCNYTERQFKRMYPESDRVFIRFIREVPELPVKFVPRDSLC